MDLLSALDAVLVPREDAKLEVPSIIPTILLEPEPKPVPAMPQEQVPEPEPSSGVMEASTPEGKPIARKPQVWRAFGNRKPLSPI